MIFPGFLIGGGDGLPTMAHQPPEHLSRGCVATGKYLFTWSRTGIHLLFVVCGYLIYGDEKRMHGCGFYISIRMRWYRKKRMYSPPSTIT